LILACVIIAGSAASYAGYLVFKVMNFLGPIALVVCGLGWALMAFGY